MYYLQILIINKYLQNLKCRLTTQLQHFIFINLVLTLHENYLKKLKWDRLQFDLHRIQMLRLKLQHYLCLFKLQKLNASGDLNQNIRMYYSLLKPYNYIML